MGGFYPLLKSKYYFDEFYHAVLVRPAYWLAEILTVQWMDKEFLDGILEGIGRGTLWFGSAFRKYFDVPVVNGAGDATGRVVRLFGFSLKPTQSGRVQQYMIVAIVVVIGAVLVATILLRF